MWNSPETPKLMEWSPFFSTLSPRATITSLVQIDLKSLHPVMNWTNWFYMMFVLHCSVYTCKISMIRNIATFPAVSWTLLPVFELIGSRWDGRPNPAGERGSTWGESDTQHTEICSDFISFLQLVSYPECNAAECEHRATLWWVEFVKNGDQIHQTDVHRGETGDLICVWVLILLRIIRL